MISMNYEGESYTLPPHKRNPSPVTFYSTSFNKLLIVFPLSRMCCLCLTLPPPHGRWYNGCYESRSCFQEGQNRISLPECVEGESRNTAGHCPSDSTTPLM